jgi:ketosteroid isomerase-like protein
MSNREAVQSIYEAFGRGDVESILTHLSDDVRWDRWPAGNGAQDAGVPWMAERMGHAGAREFFALIYEELEFNGFAQVALLEDDTRVAALIELDVTVRATGRRFQDAEIHLWTFGPDGRVSDFRHHNDTVKHAAAAARAHEPSSTVTVS